MAVDYEDERFKNVENEKQTALNSINNTYNNMINETQGYYNDLANATEEYGRTQQELQNQQTDLAIQNIEQNKEQLNKDYVREQKGAYTDWQKQSNQYGANAEAMASSGLTNSGYNASTQERMYTTYQNRVAQARDTYNRAVTEYDNQIAQARKTNSSQLAQIAYQTLQTKLQLGLEGFQYKNNLLMQQLQMQQATDDRYYARWQDVLNQINQENALEEQKRQFNASLTKSSNKGSNDKIDFSSLITDGGLDGTTYEEEIPENYVDVDDVITRGTADEDDWKWSNLLSASKTANYVGKKAGKGIRNLFK